MEWRKNISKEMAGRERVDNQTPKVVSERS